MYKVEGGELHYKGKSLGSKDEIYVDGRQDVAGYVKRRLTTSVIVYEQGDCNDNSEDSKEVWISPFLDFDSLIRDVLSHSSRLIGGN